MLVAVGAMECRLGARLIKAMTDSSRPLVVSVAEAARLLGISRGHAYKLVSTGEIPSLRLGRRVVVPRRSLERIMDRAEAVLAVTEEAESTSGA